MKPETPRSFNPSAIIHRPDYDRQFGVVGLFDHCPACQQAMKQQFVRATVKRGRQHVLAPIPVSDPS